jgi:hypothetical protein
MEEDPKELFARSERLLKLSRQLQEEANLSSQQLIDVLQRSDRAANTATWAVTQIRRPRISLDARAKLSSSQGPAQT